MSALIRSRQRGAATLVVVMILFFIISMVAAYTSRNMIFEQRTGTNLFRATQSLEAADAGLQWALMMLNTGRIDAQCVASTAPADNTFRQRYVAADVTNGMLSPRTQTGGGELTPTCVFDRATDRWRCACPDDGAPVLAAPAGPEVAPAFRIRFQPLTGSGVPMNRPGLIRVEAVGCTRLDDACLRSGDAGIATEGRTVAVVVAHISGQSITMPLAALTARGNVTASSLSVSNVRVSDGGLTVHASGTIDPGLSLTTIAGNALGGSTSPMDSTLNMPDMAAPYVSRERFFAAIFGLLTNRWVQQPAVFTLDCSGGCDADDVREALGNNPGRPLWINGNVDVDSSGDFGTATAPVLLVINGNLDFSTTGVTIHGLTVLRPVNPVTGWVTSGSGRFNGAVIVDGAVTGTGSHSIEFNGAVLEALRPTVGNYTAVPGSWRDWPMP